MSAVAARGGVRDTERALTPDLARGLMILLIALSNTAFHLWAARHGESGWHPVDGSPLDRAVQFAMIVGLDLRVYPLFAFLFGYGMVRLHDRQTAAGATPRAARALLRRRSLWLIGFGAVHAALLMAGDILGAWGLLSLVLGWLFVARRPGTLLVWSAIAVLVSLAVLVPALVVLATADTSAWAPGAVTEPTAAVYAAGQPDWPAAAVTRLSTWLYVTLAAPLSPASVAGMLLGMWAARRGVLDDPAAHLRLLAVTAGCGVTIGWLGGLPSALDHVGVWDAPAGAASEGGELLAVQAATGLAGGLGYVALVALGVALLPRAVLGSAGVRAVTAVGKRSLSAYLTHSLLFAPVLAAWGFGLGAHLGSASMAAFAVAVWLVTVVGAVALERRGLRGPAEAVLRRLVYR